MRRARTPDPIDPEGRKVIRNPGDPVGGGACLGGDWPIGHH